LDNFSVFLPGYLSLLPPWMEVGMHCIIADYQIVNYYNF